jgi:hypothetical protein
VNTSTKLEFDFYLMEDADGNQKSSGAEKENKKGNCASQGKTRRVLRAGGEKKENQSAENVR